MGSNTVATKRNDREPTLEEWHAILTFVVGENLLVQGAIEYFLLNSATGIAYLEGARRLRPNLKIDNSLELDDVIATHDAGKLLGQLIAEKRCGTDSTFLIWKDIWKDSTMGVSELYSLAIEIATAWEARSTSEAELARLRQVRAAIEEELRLETYVSWRRDISRDEDDL